MFEFLLIMWKMWKISEVQIDNATAKNYITQEQALAIKNTAR